MVSQISLLAFQINTLTMSYLFYAFSAGRKEWSLEESKEIREYFKEWITLPAPSRSLPGNLATFNVALFELLWSIWLFFQFRPTVE